jgi:nicotinamidase-related amidase
MENMKKALLVMDMQLPILGMTCNPSELISNVAKAIKKAREKEIPVIFVVLGFRNGLPEISENNQIFYSFKKQLENVDMDNWSTIHPDLGLKKDDIIVTKRRVSAFTGSDLEVVLRGLNIQHLTLTGIATSGIVLSTLREAADKDFKLTVISDCCLDSDEEVHNVLMEKVFPRQAEVVSLDEWEK